jgi:hypothetical protein
MRFVSNGVRSHLVLPSGPRTGNEGVIHRVYIRRMRTDRRLFAIACLAAVVAASPRLAAQQIALTDKITRLDGTWTRAPEKGWGGICGVPASNGMSLSVSPAEISIQADTFSQGVSSQRLMPIGVVKLDGTETTLSDGRTATASTDAGWLAITMTRERNGFANVMREVYILNGNRDELTVWRTLNVRRPDGLPDKIDCGNHHAIVYSRKP